MGGMERCDADRLAQYFAGVSELSAIVSLECTRVIGGSRKASYEALDHSKQDTSMNAAFSIPCGVTEQAYGPNAWGRTVVR